MALRVSGQNCKCFKILLFFNSQKTLGYKENDARLKYSNIDPPRIYVRILIHRTWLVAVGLLISDWMRKVREVFKPIPSVAKMGITFDTQVISTLMTCIQFVTRMGQRKSSESPIGNDFRPSV